MGNPAPDVVVAEGRLPDHRRGDLAALEVGLTEAAEPAEPVPADGLETLQLVDHGAEDDLRAGRRHGLGPRLGEGLLTEDDHREHVEVAGGTTRGTAVHEPAG